AEILREKGTDRTKFLRGQVDKYTWVDIGSSWVISDLLAAILCGQLERADEIYVKRMRIWNRYNIELANWATDNNVMMPVVPEGCEHTGHVFFLRLPTGDSRDRLISHLRSHGILAVFHYQPLHLSAVGRSLGGREGQFPVTEQAGDCLVRLPLFNSLTDAEQLFIIDTIRMFNVK
ncbi:MAG: dTDP-4-amino-4,6-dideoxygalactose transaminase, partial [Actinobacteria bacterium]|nr:dTDP-4-amino-4,6-dideoxygalactose transaminase [Actinomycetota bacterium]